MKVITKNLWYIHNNNILKELDLPMLEIFYRAIVKTYLQAATAHPKFGVLGGALPSICPIILPL